MNMRKMKLILAFLLSVTMFSFPMPAFSETESTGMYCYEGNGIEYELHDGGYAVSIYFGSKSLVIIPAKINGKPVNAILSGAFANNKKLKDIILPDGLTSIEDDAFQNCSSLSGITLPDGLHSIGDQAFSGCSSLSSIALPSGLTSIGGETFESCSSLRKITLPDGLTSIGGGAFESCSSLKKITLPGGLTSIGDSAFRECSSLSSITLPNGLTSIEDDAFKNCSNLKNVMIPDDVVTIGKGAFDKCNRLKVSCNKDGCAYCYCKLYSIPIISTGKVSSVKAYADGQKIIYVQKGNGYMACRCFGSKTKIVIPKMVNGETVNSISASAFKDDESLKSIVLPAGITSIGDDAFRDCNALSSINLPEGLASIGNYAFLNCYTLNNITLPEGLTNIGEGAFEECWKLSDIVIPNSITSIGESTFCSCSSLSGITLPAGITSIGDYAFGGCKISSIMLPEGLISIGERAFEECGYLNKIVIPNSVTSIGECAFEECGDLSSIILPDGLSRIEDRTFEECTSLNGITLPDGLTSIGAGAFGYCISLNSITLPDSLTSIEVGTFEDCSSLSSITLPKSLTRIGDDAFNGCSSLSDITLPDGMKSICGDAFRNCSKLKSITIPAAVDNIVTTSFDGISNLNISGYAGSCADFYAAMKKIPFTSIGELENSEIYVDSNGIAYLENNGEYSISGYYGSKSDLVIPETVNGEPVTGIDSEAFAYSYKLKNVVIPNSVTSIGDKAFFFAFEKSGYAYITLPSSIKKIGKCALVMKEGIDYSDQIFYCNKGSYAYFYLTSKAYQSGKDFTIVKLDDLGAPTALKASSSNYNEISVKWKKMKGVTGYEIYRSSSENGTYELVGTTAGTSYTNSGLSTGESYFLKVRAYVQQGMTKIYGNYSPVVKAKPVPNIPASFKVGKGSAKSIEVTWKSVKGSSGYEVFRSRSKSGKYKLIKRTKGTSFDDKGIKSGKSYYYRMRCYRTVEKVKVYSGWTATNHKKA